MEYRYCTLSIIDLHVRETELKNILAVYPSPDEDLQVAVEKSRSF